MLTLPDPQGWHVRSNVRVWKECNCHPAGLLLYCMAQVPVSNVRKKLKKIHSFTKTLSILDKIPVTLQ